MKMLQLPCSHFIVVYATVFIYLNLTCFVCVPTCCVFFLFIQANARSQCCLHCNFSVYNTVNEGFDYTRTSVTFMIL